jgi:hypothetical protein
MKLLLTYLIFIYSSTLLHSQRCGEKLLLDGSDTYVSSGFDTTNNWYAITSPYTNKLRVNINNEYFSEVLDNVKPPRFSPDGKKWAYEGTINGVAKLFTNDTTIILGNYIIGSVHFSYSTNELLYTYLNESSYIISYRENKIVANNRNSNVFLSSNGNQIAFTVKMGSNDILFVNGKEIANDNKITPIGFWENGDFVYTLFDGTQYSLYIGNKRIESNKREIPEVVINPNCNFMAFSYITLSGQSFVASYTDKYYEPSVGRAYDFVSNLVVHTFEEMFAYCAGEQNKMNVVFNNTAYPAGNSITYPQFTNDGKELFFVGCENNNCFININGMQSKLKGSFKSDDNFYMKSASKTFAYLSSTNLVLMNITEKMMHAGKMMDKFQDIRYNPRNGNYEALGLINNSLWLLYCQ